MANLEYIFELYEFIHDDIKFILKSGIRLKILTSLADGSRLIREIKKEQDLSFATISNNMRLLQDRGLVTKVNDYYHISQTGKFQLNRVLDLMKSMAVTKDFEDLWLNHDLSGISEDLLLNIDVLRDSILIKADNKDVFKPYTEFYNVITSANWIKGISPFFNPADHDLFNDISKKGVKIDLILTDEVIEQIVKAIKLKDLLKEINTVLNNNLTLWRYDGEIKVGFTLTDKCISLGLLNTNGSYDQNRDLINSSSDAREWGERLFDDYLSKSKKLSAVDLASYFIRK